MSDENPLDVTPERALELAKEIIDKHGNNIHGIIICFKYENDYIIEIDPYICGGGLTVLETLGLLAFTQYRVTADTRDSQNE